MFGCGLISYECNVLVPFHSFLMPELIYCCILYDFITQCFFCGLIKNLFRLKSRRNKRSEPYYYPLLWRVIRRGRLTILSREIPHGTLGKSLSSETLFYIKT